MNRTENFSDDARRKMRYSLAGGSGSFAGIGISGCDRLSGNRQARFSEAIQEITEIRKQICQKADEKTACADEKYDMMQEQDKECGGNIRTGPADGITVVCKYVGSCQKAIRISMDGSSETSIVTSGSYFQQYFSRNLSETEQQKFIDEIVESITPVCRGMGGDGRGIYEDSEALRSLLAADHSETTEFQYVALQQLILSCAGDGINYGLYEKIANAAYQERNGKFCLTENYKRTASLMDLYTQSEVEKAIREGRWDTDEMHYLQNLNALNLSLGLSLPEVDTEYNARGRVQMDFHITESATGIHLTLSNCDKKAFVSMYSANLAKTEVDLMQQKEKGSQKDGTEAFYDALWKGGGEKVKSLTLGQGKKHLEVLAGLTGVTSGGIKAVYDMAGIVTDSYDAMEQAEAENRMHEENAEHLALLSFSGNIFGAGNLIDGKYYVNRHVNRQELGYLVEFYREHPGARQDVTAEDLERISRDYPGISEEDKEIIRNFCEVMRAPGTSDIYSEREYEAWKGEKGYGY